MPNSPFLVPAMPIYYAIDDDVTMMPDRIPQCDIKMILVEKGISPLRKPPAHQRPR